MGDLSAHFSRAEFVCHGFGKKGHVDHQLEISPRLLELVEVLRAIDGRPLKIVSGHRCRWWNRKVGGARGSMHLDGRAADLAPGRFTPAVALAAGARGVGVDRDGWVVHVDVRGGRAVTFAD